MSASQVSLDLGSSSVDTVQENQVLVHGQTKWMGNWQVRNFHGYQQSREGGVGDWQFYVIGFDATPAGTAGKCSVLMADGSKQSVPIDAKDRISVQGKLYGRSQWNH